MEAPDYTITTTYQLESLIERFVPKLFYDWNYNFENGITIYVPKKYIDILKQYLEVHLPRRRYEVLDIAEK